MVSAAFWRNRKVLVTGHTGFKGSWLCLWLQSLGARVSGFALPPPTTPSLFEIAGIGDILDHSRIADIRYPEAIDDALKSAEPEIVFHLAAQAIVGEGYRDPIGTYATNVMGTAHLLQAVRKAPSVRGVVVVTSDKCYENRETDTAYRENAPLGGHDPYSSSKACVEILAHSWRRSFLDDRSGPFLATARAGNVVGGGDWSAHRLVPDLLAAFADRRTARLRRPDAVRPWQHVLEPLAGYLMLAERLACGEVGHDGSDAWNFGPDASDCVPVREVATLLQQQWGSGAAWEAESGDFPHEAGLLRLDAGAARRVLKWRQRWPLTIAIRQTTAWHRAWIAGEDMQRFSLRQIDDYQASAKDAPSS
ncbi:MAG: CDP-glucose 4,6-dehydratase [Candidatus Accumulibacter sp.]|uniref:CDP-glucose 4,6-dehydratase n=1 Tax=Accumulibacter sp. TaxID=2053492 RepID=UPI002878483D|nr:CDP-glucose 4,6-dehydratase [Accumulibacter sp.]MDS4013441.1 CDP-glucose 4,6-dehydratase [Accumulibacter sp.]